MNAVCFYLLVPFSSVDVRLFVVSKGVLLLWCLEKAFSACGISGCYLGRDDITVTCKMASMLEKLCFAVVAGLFRLAVDS